jgi:hypothetical protein
MSKFRVDKAEMVFQGNDLLFYRKKCAQDDLNNKFKHINNAMDNAFKLIDKKIPELRNGISAPDLSGYDCDVFVMIHQHDITTTGDDETLCILTRFEGPKKSSSGLMILKQVMCIKVFMIL